jgi:hypothetical protein
MLVFSLNLQAILNAILTVSPIDGGLHRYVQETNGDRGGRDNGGSLCIAG